MNLLEILKNRKFQIGAGLFVVGLTAYLTRKHWLPSKKEEVKNNEGVLKNNVTETNKQSTPVSNDLESQFNKAISDSFEYAKQNPKVQVSGNAANQLAFFKTLNDNEKKLAIDSSKLMLEMFKSIKGKEDNQVVALTALGLFEQKAQSLVKKYGISDERAKVIMQGGK